MDRDEVAVEWCVVLIVVTINIRHQVTARQQHDIVEEVRYGSYMGHIGPYGLTSHTLRRHLRKGESGTKRNFSLCKHPFAPRILTPRPDLTPRNLSAQKMVPKPEKRRKNTKNPEKGSKKGPKRVQKPPKTPKNGFFVFFWFFSVFLLPYEIKVYRSDLHKIERRNK